MNPLTLNLLPPLTPQIEPLEFEPPVSEQFQESDEELEGLDDEDNEDSEVILSDEDFEDKEDD